jgi:hypothetical protein
MLFNINTIILVLSLVLASTAAPLPQNLPNTLFTPELLKRTAQNSIAAKNFFLVAK